MIAARQSGAGAARILLLTAVLAAAGVVGGYALLRDDAQAEPAAPFNPWTGPVPIRTVDAVRAELPVTLQAVGTVVPLATVTVRGRVDGELKRLLFEEGQEVAAGELLAEIDPAPYRARLAEAEAEQARNTARLRNAERELARFRALSAQNSVARQQVDTQEATVAELRAVIAADQARADDARLQLSWTRVLAPIGGRLGLREIDAGNLVRAADAAGIVSIVRTRPISVLFSVPEHALPAVRAALHAGETPVVEARDRDDRVTLAVGRLRTLDNQIDTTTGTLRLKAEFANEDEALFPNQFVNVRVQVGELVDAVSIPVDAVQYGARGPYVYVIADGRARVRDVTPGPAGGGRVAIEQGLAPGEVVALEGLDRLRDGREVLLVADDAPRAPLAADAPLSPHGAVLAPGGG